MGFGHDQPPAAGTNSLDIAGDVAGLILAISPRPRFVAEHERAEEDLAHWVAGEEQADIALRAAHLAQELQVALWPDRAGEAAVSDVSEIARVFGSELDHRA